MSHEAIVRDDLAKATKAQTKNIKILSTLVIVRKMDLDPFN
jgi:hypothetical protein